MPEIDTINQKLMRVAKPEKIPFTKRILATPLEVLGVMVPDSRKIAKEYKNLDIYEMYNLFDELIKSRIHEERCLAVHILQQYKKQFNIETWRFLRQRMSYFITWDVIDVLATDVFAEILKNNLGLIGEVKEMANSNNFWERRLAIESTIKLIKRNKLDLTILLAEKLIYDDNEYVQKGAGWMLREAGKRNRIMISEFIKMHLDMKNIAFSYATEKIKELRVLRKETKQDKTKDKLFDKFDKLEYEQIKELMIKMKINFEGEILNVKKEDIFNKILEIKNIEEVKNQLVSL